MKRKTERQHRALLNLCLREFRRLYVDQPRANFNGNAAVKAIHHFLRTTK